MESCLRSMETTHRTILMLRCKVVVVGDATGRKISADLHVPQRRRQLPEAVRHDVLGRLPGQAGGHSRHWAFVGAVELYLFDCAGDPSSTRSVTHEYICF